MSNWKVIEDGDHHYLVSPADDVVDEGPKPYLDREAEIKNAQRDKALRIAAVQEKVKPKAGS
jgi:hypothetical protein